MPPKQRKRKEQVASGTEGKMGSEVKKSKGSASGICLEDYLSQKEWKQELKHEFEQAYIKEIEEKLQSEESSGATIFPPRDLIFNALNRTPLSKVKIVLLGQDPYHDDGQAMGLAFSVPKGIAVPPSLRNIYKELATDVTGFQDPGHGCLEKWADQGILLLNATLTVQAHKANSHSEFGWQKFTDRVIQLISEKSSGVVFMLWGNFAHKKEKLIDETKHVILKDAHPSPLSFGKFKGCRCFSRANDSLKTKGRGMVDWQL